MFLFQISRSRQWWDTQRDVDRLNYIPIYWLRGHGTKYLLWAGSFGYYRYNGKYLVFKAGSDRISLIPSWLISSNCTSAAGVDLEKSSSVYNYTIWNAIQFLSGIWNAYIWIHVAFQVALIRRVKLFSCRRFHKELRLVLSLVRTSNSS